MKTLLVLNLLTVSGRLREMALNWALEELKKLGFDVARFLDGRVSLQRVGVLYVNHSSDATLALNVEYDCNLDSSFYKQHAQIAKVFDAHNSMNAFLAEAAIFIKAEKEKPFKLQIKGVDVLITKDGALVDFTDLLNHVQSEAMKLHKAKFGQAE
jgi:hypothetical protein